MAKPRSALMRDLIWRLEAAGFDLFTVIIRLLPLDFASGCGGALFKALGPLTSAHRTAERSLRLAFPNMGEGERAAILAAQWDNFGRYVFEFPVTDRLSVASGRVELVNFERMTDVAKSGRPVVLLTGHFSNLEIMATAIVAAGIECEITYRAANNPYVDARIKASRRRYGVRLLAPKGGEGARALLEAMSVGRSVAILNDQRYDDGVAGPFFGREVMTNPAAARLALRFKTYIQPASIFRLKGARFRFVTYEPIEVVNTGDRAADMAAGVAAINAFIEARVREQPGEWWWLHKRWPAGDYKALAAEGF